MGKSKTEKEKLVVLRDFLLKTDCLNTLGELVSEPNVFEVLKASQYEIRHSNTLAWLLNPNENHGLGDSFLKEIIRIAILNQTEDEGEYICDDCIGNDIVKDREYWILDDFRNIRVSREEPLPKENGKKGKSHSLDLVITADGEAQSEKPQRRYLIVIENKVKARESTYQNKSQTEKYFEESQKAKFYEKRNRDNKRMYLYLTADVEDRADDKHWGHLTYENIVNALNNSCIGKSIPRNASLIIENYIRSINREILGDEKLAETVREVYRENKEAIDILLDQHKKESSSDSELDTIASVIIDRYSKELDLIENNKRDLSNIVANYIRQSLADRERDKKDIKATAINTKAYIKINTPRMDEIMGAMESEESPWGTKDKYYYEFNTRQYVDEDNKPTVKVSFYLVLGGGKCLKDEDTKEKQREIGSLMNARDTKGEEYKYKRCHIEKKDDFKVFSQKGEETGTLEKEVKQYVEERINAALKKENEILAILEEKGLYSKS